MMNESVWLASNDPAAMLQHLQGGWYGYISTPHGPNRPALMSDRKLRLFAVACCRQVWDRLTDDAICPKCKGEGGFAPGKGIGGQWTSVPCVTCEGTGRINRSRRAVEVAERYADGKATAEELRHARIELTGGIESLAFFACSQNISHDVGVIAANEIPAKSTQAALLREIFGNPWRPVLTHKLIETRDAKDVPGREHFLFGELKIIPPAWFTPDVLAVAASIYAEQRWQDMPILADALEDAGCDNVDILNHCRRLRTDRHIPGNTQCPLHFARIGASSDCTCICPRQVSHVRGCWVVDIILGKE